MLDLLQARGLAVEPVRAKHLHRRWSSVFHARNWEDLESQCVGARAVARYEERAASAFYLMQGHLTVDEAVLCRGALPAYADLCALRSDDLYLFPLDFSWTLVLSHEMDSLCPGPLFALPYAER